MSKCIGRGAFRLRGKQPRKRGTTLGVPPIHILYLPKCRNPLSEKPDTPGRVAFDLKPSQITCVHTMWTHTSFGTITTLRGPSFDETLVLLTARSTPLTSPREAKWAGPVMHSAYTGCLTSGLHLSGGFKTRIGMEHEGRWIRTAINGSRSSPSREGNLSLSACDMSMI